MDKWTRLARLTDAQRSLEATEKHVSDCAVSARMAGASWEEIGYVLGLTKQGAHRRYADKLPYAFPSDD